VDFFEEIAMSVWPRLLGFLTLLALGTAAPARDLARSQNEVTAVVFTPDGKTLIWASLDGYLYYWDVARNRERLRVEAHKDGVYGLALSAEGKVLASAGADGLVRVWDVARIKEVRRLEGHAKAVVAVAFAPDGKLLASGGYDRTVRLWDSAAGKELRTLKDHESTVTCVAFFPDGKTLASGGVVPASMGNFQGGTQGNFIRLWDAATGTQVAQLPVSGERVAVSADGRTLTAAAWYLNFVPAKNQGLNFGAFSLDGGSRLSVWDLVRGRERLKLEEYWTALALSADGQFLASGWGSRLHGGGIVLSNGNRNEGIHLWELATGKEVLRFSVPEDEATVLALSPNGTRLAVGRKDGTVKIWDLAPRRWKPEGVQSLGPREWEARWNALAGEDAVPAYEAIWTLAAGGDKAVAFLKERLKPAAPPDARIRRLVADLDSDRFAVRESASKELRQLGVRAEPLLLQVLRAKPSPELRRRVEDLLAAGADHLDPEALRQSRAVQVLERVATREAQEVLKGLARGAPEAPLTQQAAGTLQRLAGRLAAVP
jgi:WD40 repeat protein